MIVRIARAKVGHRQAPQMKKPIPSGVGFFIWGAALAVTCDRDENTPSRCVTNTPDCQSVPEKHRPHKACFSAG